ncbi:MAG: polyprenol monophosphomannose synthase, partial [Candidatus Bathyarchaeia archaeon]
NLEVNSEIGILLPTYCEAANIEKLIQEILNLNLNVSILVIDDSSPDKTAEIVRTLQKKHENILLLVRPCKSGLGTAITDGFKVFLSLKNTPKCIVTMDADYSHNPKEIPKLIQPIHEGYDLVIGSRYRRGGCVKDWGLSRIAISKIANLITTIRIHAKLSDYTSGMRCYSTKLVRGIINDLHSHTYEIQIETIRQANMRRFKIKEMPITFVNRKKGKSKLTITEIKDFLSYILSLNRRY